MTLESIEAIINRTKGRSGWFIEGFGAEDAVRQLAAEFELLVAEINRLSEELRVEKSKAVAGMNIDRAIAAIRSAERVFGARQKDSDHDEDCWVFKEDRCKCPADHGFAYLRQAERLLLGKS